ncbi:hypothetical protein B6U90_06370 [Thermoplasmatales archaeon ex4484_6]|nr:MAG: hypothetical protein B6U90_06370 [Thermoplasmatales archaeon ex4484_6]RLF68765.1 MAG: hypothetical protein DRN57_02935 [Thermoplasmata archaeon]
MSSLVIEGAMNLEGETLTVVIEGNRISEILEGRVRGRDADRTLKGDGLLVMPGLCNSHTHAAMTILRGVGEDKELHPWLEEDIWPLESRMRVEHIRAGMALACVEMIGSGTTLFNDMYFMEGDVADVVADSGLRAVLGEGFIDLGDRERMEDQIRGVERSIRGIESLGCSRVMPSISPHAVYTVSPDGFRWCAERSGELDIPLHVHLSETAEEVKQCRSAHGMSPAEVIDGYGALSERTVAAHCVHMTDGDISLLRERNVSVCHVPVSNMKLSVGGQFRYPEFGRAGINICLGTDGAASNNSLDMFQTGKMTGLLCRQGFGASSIRTADILRMATLNGYRALGVDGGRLEEGALADIILLDLKHPSMVPYHDMISNVIYSAGPSAVVHSVIDGEVVMENGRVRNGDRIVEMAVNLARDLMAGDGNE